MDQAPDLTPTQLCKQWCLHRGGDGIIHGARLSTFWHFTHSLSWKCKAKTTTRLVRVTTPVLILKEIVCRSEKHFKCWAGPGRNEQSCNNHKLLLFMGCTSHYTASEKTTQQPGLAGQNLVRRSCKRQSSGPCFTACALSFCSLHPPAASLPH